MIHFKFAEIIPDHNLTFDCNVLKLKHQFNGFINDGCTFRTLHRTEVLRFSKNYRAGVAKGSPENRMDMKLPSYKQEHFW